MRHPADNRVHFSELKQFSRSAAHYRHACENARTVTRPMTVGSVADCIVFGNRGWVIYPGKVRNGREWDAFRAATQGQITCIQSEYDDAAGAADAVRTHPLAIELLDGCDFQRVMQWEAFGLECAAGIPGERGGFDAITPLGHHNGRIVDLKVTASTDPDELMRHVLKMHWHCQAAWYLAGAEALGYGELEFYLLCVESSAPHCVTALKLSAPVLEHGRKQLTLWSEDLRNCEASDHWPGYVQTIQTVQLPEWMEEVVDDEG
jgi:hypothetical protein